MTRVGVDIGYGFTKAMSDAGKKVIFPSTVARKIFYGDDFGVGNRKDKQYEIEYMGKVYGVGMEAIWSGAPLMFTDDRFVSQEAKILVLTALSALGTDQEIELGLGLPITLYRTDLKDKVRDYFEYAEESVIFNGQPVRYHITKCRVYAQSIGALMGLDEEAPQGLLMTIDVGYKTTDVVTVRNTEDDIEIVPDLTFTVDEGISVAVERVGLELQRKYKISYDMNQLMDIENKTTIPVRGRQVDIREIRDEALSYVASEIMSEIVRKAQRKLGTLAGMYVAGGGAPVLAEKLKSVYDAVKLIPDSQFANVRGYLKMLMLDQEEEGEGR